MWSVEAAACSCSGAVSCGQTNWIPTLAGVNGFESADGGSLLFNELNKWSSYLWLRRGRPLGRGRDVYQGASEKLARRKGRQLASLSVPLQLLIYPRKGKFGWTSVGRTLVGSASGPGRPPPSLQIVPTVITVSHIYDPLRASWSKKSLGVWEMFLSCGAFISTGPSRSLAIPGNDQRT